MTAQPENGHDKAATNGLIAVNEVGRQICEPAIKAFACGSAELLSLASRRMQAYMELPMRLGSCRSPHELLAEQTRFAQTAWAQYTECTTRLFTTFQSLARPSEGLVEAWQSALNAPAVWSAQREAHDYLEDSSRRQVRDEAQSGRSRRAA
jgi:hypothetical protein